MACVYEKEVRVLVQSILRQDGLCVGVGWLARRQVHWCMVGMFGWLAGWLVGWLAGMVYWFIYNPSLLSAYAGCMYNRVPAMPGIGRPELWRWAGHRTEPLIAGVRRFPFVLTSHES